MHAELPAFSRPSADRSHVRLRLARLPAAQTALALAPALLALVLYARSAPLGFLADDFLYLDWARHGVSQLLRHVTVASNPQMIRPLPALAWLVGQLRHGALLLHGVSLMLHAAAGFLVALIVRRGTSPAGDDSPWRGAAAGGLFVAFPLFTEPVVWLSASFDLWACVFALGALLVAREGGTGAAAWATVLFSLALLSKESVLLLPLVVAALWPWREVRKAVLLMSGVAALYVVLRLVLFAGPGGYLTPAGRSLLWSPDLMSIVRNLALRLPFQVLVAFRRAGELPCGEWVAGLVSAALLVPLLVGCVRTGGPRSGLRSHSAGATRLALAVLFAFLPVLPVFSIEVDQENSRLLYFPASIAAIALARAAGPASPFMRRLALALLLYWSAATVWNQSAWREASWEVARTEEAMLQFVPRLPPSATVFVAGHDTWRGAYTLRNAVAAAAAWLDLRPDLHWNLGTVASIERPWRERLGRSVFEIGIDAAGRPIDWTPCETALGPAPAPERVLVDWPPHSPAHEARDRAATLADPVLPPTALRRPLAAIQVRLELGPGRPAKEVPGRLFWLPPDFQRYNQSDSAEFVLGPRAPSEIIVRVPPTLAPRQRPMSVLGLWLHLPPEYAPLVRTVRVAEVPQVCVTPPKLPLRMEP